jgi:hypothetical protein
MNSAGNGQDTEPGSSQEFWVAVFKGTIFGYPTPEDSKPIQFAANVRVLNI